jgi:hypothetical protein
MNENDNSSPNRSGMIAGSFPEQNRIKFKKTDNGLLLQVIQLFVIIDQIALRRHKTNH